MKKTITAKFVNLPRVGKKYGNVKDENDVGYAVPKEMTGRFIKGNRYEIDYEEQQWGESTVFVVTGVNFLAGDASPSAVPLQLTDRWWLNFVSNCCGHAVASGTIKNPDDLQGWAKHAYHAINKCHEPFQDDL